MNPYSRLAATILVLVTLVTLFVVMWQMDRPFTAGDPPSVAAECCQGRRQKLRAPTSFGSGPLPFFSGVGPELQTLSVEDCQLYMSAMGGSIVRI